VEPYKLPCTAAPVHSVPITPAMSLSVLSGQGLFERGRHQDLNLGLDPQAEQARAGRDRAQLEGERLSAEFGSPLNRGNRRGRPRRARRARIRCSARSPSRGRCLSGARASRTFRFRKA
jgi:hypothetical protein